MSTSPVMPWQKYGNPQAQSSQKPWEKYSSPEKTAEPTWQKSVSTGQGEQSTMGHLVDKAATGIVNAAPTVGTIAGGMAGALAGPAGAIAGAAAGAGAGEAFKENKAGGKNLHEISNKEVGKQMAFGGASEAAGLGAAKVAGKAISLIPNKEYAGQVLKSVMGQAKDVPVNLQRSGNEIMRVAELADRGATMPSSIRKLIARATDPTKPPITYAEARDFYSNITRLSSKEGQSITPVMKRQIAVVTKALRDDIGDAAAQVGKSAEYYAGLKQYAQAAKIQQMASKMMKWALPAAASAAGAGGGYEIYKALVK